MERPSKVIERPDSRYIIEWVGYMVRVRAFSSVTTKDYRIRLRNFLEYLMDEFETQHLEATTEDMIVAYKVHLGNRGLASSSIDLYLMTIRMFFKWMVKKKHMPANPFPDDLTVRQTERYPKVIPSPAEIFKMRYRKDVPLRSIFVFEVLLSTGMRKAELQQLRSEDINFNDRPVSIETGYASDVVGGSIYLDPTVGVLKGKRPRTVYLSRFAAKWTKLYMKAYRIPFNSPVPLIPYCRSSIDKWMKNLGRGIIKGTRDNFKEPKQRNVGFSDVDAATYKDLDPAFLAAMKRRQGTEETKSEVERIPEQRNTNKTRGNNLHCHALRHSFTCLQYYYNWWGERNNGFRLMEMLGHRELTATSAYMQRLSLVDDMQEWRRVWLGRITDWQGYTK